MDTNATSELMKLVNPDYPDQRRRRVPEIWNEVLDRLTRASRLHEVCCPRTPTLERESLLFRHGPAIVELAKRFDGGLWCHPQYNIEAQQLYLAALAVGGKNQVKRLSRNLVYGGELNSWSNWFQIEVKMGHPQYSAEEVRTERDDTHARAAQLFEQWKVSTTKVKEVFDKERRAKGRLLAKQYLKYLNYMHQQNIGEIELDPFSILDTSSHQMAMIRYGLENSGVCDPGLQDIIEFAVSESACSTPTNTVRAALYAYEARQVAGGMQKPKSSMWLDIELISTMLPYVDAVLVEAHFAAGLRQMRRLLPEECQSVLVFSTRKLHQFVDYLDDLIKGVSQDQQKAAEALYSDERFLQRGAE